MSYSGREPLADIVGTLKASLPGLQKLLRAQVDVPTLHPVIEAISILLERVERGEIVEHDPTGTSPDGGSALGSAEPPPRG